MYSTPFVQNYPNHVSSDPAAIVSYSVQKHPAVTNVTPLPVFCYTIYTCNRTRRFFFLYNVRFVTCFNKRIYDRVEHRPQTLSVPIFSSVLCCCLHLSPALDLYPTVHISFLMFFGRSLPLQQCDVHCTACHCNILQCAQPSQVIFLRRFWFTTLAPIQYRMLSFEIWNFVVVK